MTGSFSLVMLKIYYYAVTLTYNIVMSLDLKLADAGGIYGIQRACKGKIFL